MAGLIIKDMRILSKKFKIIEMLVHILLSILFAWLYGINFLVPILAFLFSLSNINCFYSLDTEDEKVNWRQQLSALPLTKSEIINSRHVTILLLSIIQIVVIMLFSLIGMIFLQEINLSDSLFVSFIASFVVFISGILHISLKQVLGSTASVLSMVLSMIILGVVAYLWSQMNVDIFSSNTSDYIYTLVIFIAMAVIIERLAFLIEKKCYYFKVK